MSKRAYTVLPPDREEKVLGIFVRDASFYRTFFPLLLVIVLQQLAALAVNLADNIMLGRYSELALSGASLVNQLQFTLQQIAAGIGMGIVVLAAQYWGQKRTEPIKKIISLGVKCGFFSGVLFFAISQLAPAGVLGLFTRDTEVIAEGVRYLKVICWTYPVFGLSNSLMYALQSVETAMIGTVMSCSTICINVCLNYCLIYGNFGAPELGIVGAAVATLVSRLVELGIILVYILFLDKKLHMKLWELLRWDGTYLQDYLKVSTPIVISGLLWGVAQAAQTAIPGHMSATAIAANSIAIILFEIFAVLGAGLCQHRLSGHWQDHRGGEAGQGEGLFQDHAGHLPPRRPVLRRDALLVQGLDRELLHCLPSSQGHGGGLYDRPQRGQHRQLL